MKYLVQSKINDGLAEAPPYEVEVESVEELLFDLRSLDTFTNDYGVPMGVGSAVLIQRIE